MSGRYYTAEQLEQVRAMVAAGKTAREIGKVFGRTRESVVRIVSRHNLGKWAHGPTDMKPVPDGFAEMWAKHPQKELCRIYRASSTAVQRWVTQSGLKRPSHVRVKPKVPKAVVAASAPVPRAKRPARIVNRVTAPIDRPHLDNTLPGRAAEFLRRFGPVTRCNAAGRYDPNGAFWSRSGSLPLNAEEVVARARRNGWNPDAWQQVAA